MKPIRARVLQTNLAKEDYAPKGPRYLSYTDLCFYPIPLPTTPYAPLPASHALVPHSQGFSPRQQGCELLGPNLGNDNELIRIIREN